jgi:hypothetical protein
MGIDALNSVTRIDHWDFVAGVLIGAVGLLVLEFLASLLALYFGWF